MKHTHTHTCSELDMVLCDKFVALPQFRARLLLFFSNSRREFIDYKQTLDILIPVLQRDCNPPSSPPPPPLGPAPAFGGVINKFVYLNPLLTVNAPEFLQEFWRIKLSQQGSKFPSSGFVIFEDEPGDRPPYVTFVTLPGGSCFGNFEHCQTKEDARNSAAKIALMNSVLNEHRSW